MLTVLKPYNWTGANIRRLRKVYLRSNQDDFASLIGMSRWALSHWETGKWNPLNPRRMTRLTGALRNMDTLAREHHFEETT